MALRHFVERVWEIPAGKPLSCLATGRSVSRTTGRGGPYGRPGGRNGIMAAVYKKKYPTPMPEGAEVIERRGKKMARWTNGKGQERMAEVLNDGRVQFVSDCWYVRYTDASGKMRRESTGCRDKRAAERALADILSNVEKVKVGVEIPADQHGSLAPGFDVEFHEHVRPVVAPAPVGAPAAAPRPDEAVIVVDITS